MGHRIHFAGVNTRGLAEATKGQDILMSYADVKKDPGFWGWMKPLLERGHFRSVILDSGAFTELSQRKRGNEFKVGVEEFATFAAEHQHLFTWVANLDDIEGDVERSNANFAALRAAGVKNLVPVFHEGESDEQLRHCLALALSGRKALAVGCQRPKGRLVPRNVVRFLRSLFAKLGEMDPKGWVELHGFGLTRYASDQVPCQGPAEGFSFHSTDSTTWIAEACSVQRSGAYGDPKAPKGQRIEQRARALRATVASYSNVAFATGKADCGVLSFGGFNWNRANEYGHQARTVANRLANGQERALDTLQGGGTKRCACAVLLETNEEREAGKCERHLRLQQRRAHIMAGWPGDPSR